MAKYIVNQHGAVHSIPNDWEIPFGCREATVEEINQWWQAQGISVEVNNAASEHEQPDQSGERPNRRSHRH